jgi:hypothetical protein
MQQKGLPGTVFLVRAVVLLKKPEKMYRFSRKYGESNGTFYQFYRSLLVQNPQKMLKYFGGMAEGGNVDNWRGNEYTLYV